LELGASCEKIRLTLKTPEGLVFRIINDTLIAETDREPLSKLFSPVIADNKPGTFDLYIDDLAVPQDPETLEFFDI
jgi:hypothetical protein